MTFRTLISAAILMLATAFPLKSQAEEAVIFVTDWSNSMNGVVAGNVRRFALIPELVNSYFNTLGKLDRKPHVGLITFGDTGYWKSTADEGNCEKDVALRVSGDTPFDEAGPQISQQIAATSASGFTPIFSAIDLASRHANALLAGGKADAVRIVVVTDLQDTCDAKRGYVPVETGGYCALGKALSGRVNAGSDAYRGLVKIEFVVAVGKNALNIATLAKCAGAKPIAANTLEQAEDAGEQIARQGDTNPLRAPQTGDLQLQPVFDGPDDALGRAAILGQAQVVMRDAASVELGRTDSVGKVTLPIGTAVSFELAPLSGVTDGPVGAVAGQAKAVELPWRLPVVSIRVATNSDGVTLLQDATLVLRSPDTSGTAVLDVDGERAVSLLPGTYTAIVGFAEGGWAQRDFTVNKEAGKQTVLLAGYEASHTAAWVAGSPDASPLPGDMTARVGLDGLAPVALAFGAVQPIPAAPASVELRRADTVVWSTAIAPSGNTDSSLSVVGGAIWLTAQATQSGEWRLVDRTSQPTTTQWFQGDRFAQALVPGTYQLFLDGAPICPEGDSIDLRIGQPKDFGLEPAWNTEGCK